MKSKQNIMIITTILVISISISVGTAYAEIPSWVKEVAGFWAAGQIDDDEYARTIEYLVTEEIISVPIATTSTPTDPTYVIDPAHPCADLEIWAIKASSGMGFNYITQYIQSVEPNSNVINYYNKVIKGIRDSMQTNTECTRSDYPEHWKRYDHVLNAQDKYWEEMNTPTENNSILTYTISTSHPCAAIEDFTLKTAALMGLDYMSEYVNSVEPYSNVKDYYDELSGEVSDSKYTDSDKCSQVYYSEYWKIFEYTRDASLNYLQTDAYIPSSAPTPTPTPSAPTPSAPTPSAPTPTFNPNLIKVEIVSCQWSHSGSDHVKFELKFKNLDSGQSYDVEYVPYVITLNGETVSGGSRYISNLVYGESQFTTNFVQYSGDWNNCGVKIIGEW